MEKADAASPPPLAGLLASHSVFIGDSEMARRCRAFDWNSTPLGAVESWPSSLKTLTRALLASRNPILLMWGPELVQIYNDDFAPSLGQARDAVALGSKTREFWKDVWPTVGAQLESVVAEGKSHWFQDALVPIEREGHIVNAWWTYSYSPAFDDKGNIGGILVICQETTSRVHAHQAAEQSAAAYMELETQLHAVQDASPNVSTLLKSVRDSSNRIVDLEFVYANPATRKLLNLPDGSLEGRRFSQVVPEAVTAGRLARYIRVAETGEPWEEEVITSRWPDGARGFRATFIKVRDGVHVSAIDMTDRIRAAEEREHLLAAAESARAEAERANRGKSEFLAVMSHELRTPLNAIDGYAELMELEVHGPLTTEQRQDISRIRRSQRHLLGLINGVLSFARVEAGTTQFEVEDVSLADLLVSCESLVRPMLDQKGLSFDVELCESTTHIRADPEKFQQILVNLLTNAVKFTDSGTVRMSAVVDAETARITVADTGRGIESDKLQSIFEPFVQVDSRLTRKEHGVGLGLAISRELARGMQGEIRVESEFGRGSRFTVSIPLSR